MVKGKQKKEVEYKYINAMKKKKTSNLDIGLEELRIGKVHRYKSVKALVKDVWG